MLAKVRASRQEEKESLPDSCLGPYQEGAAKSDWKVSEGSAERNLTFRTREEAEAVKRRSAPQALMSQTDHDRGKRWRSGRRISMAVRGLAEVREVGRPLCGSDSALTSHRRRSLSQMRNSSTLNTSAARPRTKKTTHRRRRITSNSSWCGDSDD